MNAMTLNGFEQIRQHLHFTDNSKVLGKDHPRWTPLQKVTPVIDILLGRLQEGEGGEAKHQGM